MGYDAKDEFESFVNSEEYQTGREEKEHTGMFESFVNSEEYQTLAAIPRASS